jgi:hypothetical protein
MLIAAILLLMETGRWFGIRRRSRNREGSWGGGGGVEAAVFGLMGLLIAFTFYGAENRFETRRGMIVEEANAIGAAYHRIDLLPSNTQPQLREEFRKYVHSRLAIYQKIPDWEAVGAMNAEIKHSTAIQKEIWRQAIDATKQGDSTVQALVVPAIDRMVDIATIRPSPFRAIRLPRCGECSPLPYSHLVCWRAIACPARESETGCTSWRSLSCLAPWSM